MRVRFRSPHVVVRGDAPHSLGSRFETSSFTALFDNQPAELVDAAPDDLMAIMYTSGTTGLSKGVEISHAHAYTYASREDAARPVAEDRILVVLPLRSEEHTSELQSLMRTSYAVFCLNKK